MRDKVELDMERRQFLKKSLATVGYATLPFNFVTDTPQWRYISGAKDHQDLFQNILHTTPEDRIDHNSKYLKKWENYEQEWLPKLHVLLDTINHLDIPKSGFIMEFGSFRGHFLNAVEKKFGQSRCLGFDIHQYTAQPLKNLHIGDVRKLLPRIHSPVALAWNNVSFWMSNPRSKLAVKNYVDKYLLPGGYVIDDSLVNLPRDLVYRGCQLVMETDEFSIFSKKA